MGKSSPNHGERHYELCVTVFVSSNYLHMSMQSIIPVALAKLDPEFLLRGAKIGGLILFSR